MILIFIEIKIKNNYKKRKVVFDWEKSFKISYSRKIHYSLITNTIASPVSKENPIAKNNLKIFDNIDFIPIKTRKNLKYWFYQRKKSFPKDVIATV